MIKEMGMEQKYGLMEMYIKEIGLMIVEKEKELLNGQIKIFMMVIGKIIKKTVLEFIKEQMVIYIKENG
jgi:hypothetical protein